MTPFENIFVVVDVEDQHQRALRRAAKLAGQNGAKLKVVTVIDRLPYFWQVLVHEDYDAAWNILANARQARLDKLAGYISCDGLDDLPPWWYQGLT